MGGTGVRTRTFLGVRGIALVSAGSVLLEVSWRSPRPAESSRTGNEAVLQCSQGQWCCDRNRAADAVCCRGQIDGSDLFAIRGTQAVFVVSSQLSSITTASPSQTPTRTSSTSSSSGTTITSTSSDTRSASATSQTTERSTSVATSVSMGSTGPVTVFITSTPTSTASPPSDSDSRTNLGLIVGLAVGIPLGIIALAVVFFLLWRRRRQQRDTPSYDDKGSDSGNNIVTADPYIKGPPVAANSAVHARPASELAGTSAQQIDQVKGRSEIDGQQVPARNPARHHAKVGELDGQPARVSPSQPTPAPPYSPGRPETGLWGRIHELPG